ncbi:MAG: glycosyl hydrolase [candidate division KSB1 bacterium]|nr:glycosyl hydrolase [candidate division KSB1 bacterium]MDZ7300523.1 glycosyl hydrolase [candidate division KSB1 bacterium]MDZ7309662.1 glycosyl hydrolase [candidate division KSB1 bacterium]
MIKIDFSLTPTKLLPPIQHLFEISATKIRSIQKTWKPRWGAPVFTVKGRYTTRGWTEWTQGFQFGSALLQFDATGDEEFLALGRHGTVTVMAAHLTHVGVHDHGFNNISTYGNLWRLLREGRTPYNEWERNFYELALKCSGAVQASRWTELGNGRGYIYSFNGPHSLFADTIRSLRSLAVAHQLGHVLMGEGDQPISLLQRLVEHARTTAEFNVYYGEGRDIYDVPGRVAHESIFNLNDGSYRCPSTQQGYSPFSTWTRGLAWIICGYAEQLEFFDTLSEQVLQAFGGRKKIIDMMLRAARVTSDFYLDNSPVDGIPYWDTGAPHLHRLGDYLNQPADPFNPHEPVDSSAAAIAAQGLLRLGRFLQKHKQQKSGQRYVQAGLTIAKTLLHPPYLSEKENHQGLLLHSVYHRPRGWDYVPKSARVPSGVPSGESSMWGDYHLRELALLLWREAKGQPHLTFY